jgi:DNA topoisomerase IB
MAPRLRRVDCSQPGIRRRRRGRGFEYVDGDGARVTDPEVIDRIRELVIPPAWEDVWVCPHPNGHIQATGVDARGRKQYRYHDAWRARRDQEKFDSMVHFARALPLMRKRVGRALATSDDLTRERVLAAAVRLLDRGFFRVGGEDYAVENESYGLATMLKEHVSVDGEFMLFDYAAKSGKRRVQNVVDDDIAAIVATLKRRRGGGDELLAFKDGRRWSDIKSTDINEYVKQVTGGDFSAKDFRTWNATLLAAVALAVSGPAATRSKSARKRAITRSVKEVAHYLGNTPAVCRASYIDPRVFDRFDAGLTIGGAMSDIATMSDIGALHGAVETAVLDLIAGDEESPAIEKVA